MSRRAFELPGDGVLLTSDAVAQDFAAAVVKETPQAAAVPTNPKESTT